MVQFNQGNMENKLENTSRVKYHCYMNAKSCPHWPKSLNSRYGLVVPVKYNAEINTIMLTI